MNPKPNFHQIIVKFFEPLTKYPLRTVSASLIIGIILFFVVDIVIAELIRQNTYDIRMLSSEMIIELGPGYAEESKTHAEMVKQYSKHLEQRQLAGILRVLYPQYSPGKTLTSLSSALEKTATEDEAKKTILQAGVTSNKLYKLYEKFPRSPIEWFKSEDLPDWLKTDLQQALAEPTKMVNKLEEEKTVKAAVASCRANRQAILLLFLARLSYDNEETIRSFQKEVLRARDCTKLLAINEKDKEKQKWLYEVAKSEDRRVNVLRAMLDNNMEKVCELLKEAIEEAFEKEKGKSENKEALGADN